MLGKQKRKVRIYVENGPTVEGVMAARTRHTYVIWAPRIVENEDQPAVEISGHVEVPRERVLWYQVLG